MVTDGGKTALRKAGLPLRAEIPLRIAIGGWEE